MKLKFIYSTPILLAIVSVLLLCGCGKDNSDSELLYDVTTITSNTTTDTTTRLNNTTTYLQTTYNETTETMILTDITSYYENVTTTSENPYFGEEICDITVISITSTESTTSYCTSTITSTTSSDKNNRTFVAKFEGTYYTGQAYGVTSGLKGGSGRELINCSSQNGDIIGSIACRYVYERYGYSYNGNRTTVYLEIPQYPEMSGYYYVDDCCGSYNTIDFYFTYPSYCPFEYVGRIYDISCYIVI